MNDEFTNDEWGVNEAGQLRAYLWRGWSVGLRWASLDQKKSNHLWNRPLRLPVKLRKGWLRYKLFKTDASDGPSSHVKLRQGVQFKKLPAGGKNTSYWEKFAEGKSKLIQPNPS